MRPVFGAVGASPWQRTVEGRGTTACLNGTKLNPVTGRGSQVVRQRSAKPLFVGSIPTRASKISLQ